ncbi:MAG: DNA primase [Planctomycetota bacterium]
MAQVQRDDLKRRIREANDIVDVVGAVVQLKRAGRSHKALCPFHNEKTPSFTVNSERQTFKCFGCGEGGDVFSFVEKYERVDFKEALRMLAERAGIPLEYSREARARSAVARDRKLHLYRAQTLAAEFFAERFASPEGRPAREYIASRGLERAVADWDLGYAPDRWDGLTGKYATSGPKERLLAAAGLAKERQSGGVYDVFRGRLMFPIRDTQRRIVGFGGRILGEGEPKYLNSPETAVFAKGRLLYGLERARDEIGRSGDALVVEGYTDVIRCHEHGFTGAVATLGTALGADHIRLLRRMGARRVVLVYDADAAGVRAAERGLDILLEEDIGGAIVRLEGGLDPCDFLGARGADAFAEALSKAEDVFEFKITETLERHGARDPADVQARTEAARELMETAARSRDPVKRALLRKRVAERLEVPEETLSFPEPPRSAGTPPGAWPGALQEAGPAPGVNERPGGPEALDRRAERELAGLLLRFPRGLAIAREEAELDRIEDPLAREVVEALEAVAERIAENSGRLDSPALLDRLGEEATAFAADELAQPAVEPERMADCIRKAAVALWLGQARSRMEKLTLEIKKAEKTGDEERLGARLRERQDLVRQMHARKARSDPDARRRIEARKA